MELWHHGSVLGAIQGAHQDGFHHIIKMVAQGDFVTAQGLGPAIEVSAAHSGAEVAGGFGDIGYHVKDLGIEDVEGQVHLLGVMEDQLAVGGAVAGIHDQKLQGEGEVTVLLEVAHTAGQQHGVLAAGDADGDMVAGLDEAVVLDAADEAVPDGFAVLGDEASDSLITLNSAFLMTE